jgi:hypothetical protein
MLLLVGHSNQLDFPIEQAVAPEPCHKKWLQLRSYNGVITQVAKSDGSWDITCSLF